MDPASPVAIEVRGVYKAFRIPTQRLSRLKERVVNRFARQEFRELKALSDVSFDIHQGEFFGIVGRNGSGKSTLLKIMASIYRADAGEVRMAGTLAPFIELGVGFDPELTGRENAVLNGVMMGLTPRQANRKLPAIFDFAEIGDFAEMKLKNYSSGMLVRLAFSVMIQANTDILLIDEVLAVGDAAFQAKCSEEFRRMRRQGKTVVLVTHDMGSVEKFCDRAMLLSEGRIVEIGEPESVARRYFRLNFASPVEALSASGNEQGVGEVRLCDAWLEGADGDRLTTIEQGEPIRFRADLEALRNVSGAQFGVAVANADGITVHEFADWVGSQDQPGGDVSAGRQIRFAVDCENQLAPGRYYLNIGVSRNLNRNDVVLYAGQAVVFMVIGDQASAGLLSAEHKISVRIADD